MPSLLPLVMATLAAGLALTADAAVTLPPVGQRSDSLSPLTDRERLRGVTSVIEHFSLHPPLLDEYMGDGELPRWTLSGSTVVTNGFVRLTPDASSMFGHLWGTEALDLPSFEIVLGFRVHSPRGVGADGMALWITKERSATAGPIFGAPSAFNGIGVIFDTYDNDRKRDNPMVGLLANTPGRQHARFTPARDFSGEMEGSCVFDYRNIHLPSLATARIVYHQRTVRVYLSRSNEQDEMLCFTADNIQLDIASDKFYVGLTAGTGGVSDTHDVYFLHLSPHGDESYDYKAFHEREAAAAAQRRAEEDDVPMEGRPAAAGQQGQQGQQGEEGEEEAVEGAGERQQQEEEEEAAAAARRAELQRLQKLKAELEALRRANAKSGGKAAEGEGESDDKAAAAAAGEEEEEEEEAQKPAARRTRRAGTPAARRRRRRRTTTTPAPEEEDDEEYEDDEDVEEDEEEAAAEEQRRRQQRQRRGAGGRPGARRK